MGGVRKHHVSFGVTLTISKFESKAGPEVRKYFREVDRALKVRDEDETDRSQFRCAWKCGKVNVDSLQILDTMLREYDRRATPTNYLNNATTVNCELYIRSFGSIDPNSMDYAVDLYLRQAWVDERLNHANITQPLDLNDPNLVKAIWKPEVYFPNAKDAEFQFVTVPNVLVRINPMGEILYMLRLKLVFACMMELSKFPLDSQVCTMEIASFSKTMKELKLLWKSDVPIKMYKNMRMPQFEIEKIVPTTCQESFQIGNYSCLVAEFHMRRAIGFHLVQSYLPTILIVVISWVSFWMDVDSVPGRTTLGVTTLLTVSSKSSGIQAGLPQVSYVKAIDVWMGACTAFVFCALLEFTLVNYLWRRRPQVELRPRGGSNGICLGDKFSHTPSYTHKSTPTPSPVDAKGVPDSGGDVSPCSPLPGSSDFKLGGMSPGQDDKALVSANFARSFSQSNKIRARQIDEYCRPAAARDSVGEMATSMPTDMGEEEQRECSKRRNNIIVFGVPEKGAAQITLVVLEAEEGEFDEEQGRTCMGYTQGENSNGKVYQQRTMEQQDTPTRFISHPGGSERHSAEVETLLKVHQPEIVGVLELLYNNRKIDPEECEFNIDGYDFFRNLSQAICKRGVVRMLKEDDFEESKWCKIKLK
ncbi:glycine receptor subunit alpha-3-like [Homarus americanus]|uniref:glycine receptor subunit alpha-3-like n=1 Tax=Homarus americanus TaxID=6706 RepID=UPI001C47CEF2|nr:glycine receptor subunit alpha-3-like [Homarus americanus]